MGMVIALFVYQVIVWGIMIYKLRKAPIDTELWDEEVE
jgi:hypothetical protein